MDGMRKLCFYGVTTSKAEIIGTGYSIGSFYSIIKELSEKFRVVDIKNKKRNAWRGKIVNQPFFSKYLYREDADGCCFITGLRYAK